MRYMIEIAGQRIEVEDDKLTQGQYEDHHSGLSYNIWRIVGWEDFRDHLRSRFKDDADARSTFVEMFYTLAQSTGLARYAFEQAVESLFPAFGDSIDEIRKDVRRLVRQERNEDRYR